MSLPVPKPGLVIRYAYLWDREHKLGRDHGKDRPCVILLVRPSAEGPPLATVAPITHTQPKDTEAAVAIPILSARRLGLDQEHSWIIITELNTFHWPSADLRPVGPGKWAYGFLPSGLGKQVQEKIGRIRRITTVRRDEGSKEPPVNC